MSPVVNWSGTAWGVSMRGGRGGDTTRLAMDTGRVVIKRLHEAFAFAFERVGISSRYTSPTIREETPNEEVAPMPVCVEHSTRL